MYYCIESILKCCVAFWLGLAGLDVHKIWTSHEKRNLADKATFTLRRFEENLQKKRRKVSKGPFDI